MDSEAVQQSNAGVRPSGHRSNRRGPTARRGDASAGAAPRAALPVRHCSCVRVERPSGPRAPGARRPGHRVAGTMYVLKYCTIYSPLLSTPLHSTPSTTIVSYTYTVSQLLSYRFIMRISFFCGQRVRAASPRRRLRATTRCGASRRRRTARRTQSRATSSSWRSRRNYAMWPTCTDWATVSVLPPLHLQYTLRVVHLCFTNSKNLNAMSCRQPTCLHCLVLPRDIEVQSFWIRRASHEDNSNSILVILRLDILRVRVWRGLTVWLRLICCVVLSSACVSN